MDSKDDDMKRFVDSSLNAQKNPEFINFLSQDQENQISGAKLETKDYIAIFIALLETVFIPVIIICIIFIILGLFLSGFFGAASNNMFSYLDAQFAPIPAVVINSAIIVFVLLVVFLLLRKFVRGPAPDPKDIQPKY